MSLELRVPNKNDVLSDDEQKKLKFLSGKALVELQNGQDEINITNFKNVSQLYKFSTLSNELISEIRNNPTSRYFLDKKTLVKGPRNTNYHHIIDELNLTYTIRKTN